MGDLYQQAGATQERVWRLCAYLGRYGHQPMPLLRGCTVRELMQLADEVSTLVERENTPAKRGHDAD